MALGRNYYDVNSLNANDLSTVEIPPFMVLLGGVIYEDSIDLLFMCWIKGFSGAFHGLSEFNLI